MKRIAIIAAFPGELKPFVAGWSPVSPGTARNIEGNAIPPGPTRKQPPAGLDATATAWSPRNHALPDASAGRQEFSSAGTGVAGKGGGSAAGPGLSGVKLWRRRDGEIEIIAVCAGAGLAAARRAFQAAELGGGLDAVISAGWAGSLNENFHAGHAYELSGAVDAQTGESFPTLTVNAEGWVATSHQVAQIEEKRHLASTHQADLVDMEAVAIARLASARGIPFHCIKAVSDGLSDHLPDFNPYIGKNGQFMLVRFVAYAALRPWWWPALRRLGKQSKQAAIALNLRLRELLLELK